MRFTLPRDLYHGKGAIENLKDLKGKKAIIVTGGGSMKRFGFLDKVEQYLSLIHIYLEVKKLEIITNNINLAYRLGPHRNINVVVPPGSVRDGSYSLLGSATAGFLSGTFAGKAVLSCSAFHSKKGILSTILDEAEISRIMLELSLIHI